MVKNTVNADKYFETPHKVTKTTLLIKDGLRGSVKLAANENGMNQNDFINYVLAFYLITVMKLDEKKLMQYVKRPRPLAR